MTKPQVKKIVSGGQTGVDRAALDVAIFLELEHGGWCPRDRRAEDGRIPEQYRLRETESIDYAVRTERNVVESDGTLILSFNVLSGGTLLTASLARRNRRPLLIVDLNDHPSPTRAQLWLAQNQIQVLNVAGPRESNVRGIGKLTEDFLLRVLNGSPADEDDENGV